MKTEKPDMKVIATQKHGQIEWRLSVNGGMAQGPGHYPSVSVGTGNDADLTFQILNTSNITFAQQNPFLAQAGSSKPTGLDSQFTVTGQGTQKLTVHDSNQTSGDYYYVLNFSDGSTLDPIIKNGGCCGFANSLIGTSTGLIVGGIILLAILALVVRRFMVPADTKTKGP